MTSTAPSSERTLDRPFRILTVLQYDEVMSNKIRNVLETGDDDWHWLIRLHPLTRHLSDQYDHALRGLGLKNIDVRLATQLPLGEILRDADAVLTDYSTVSVEAAAAGIPSILMHSESADLLATYLNTYKDTLFFRPHPEEAVKLLQQLREQAQKDPREPYTSGSSEEVLQRLAQDNSERSLFYERRAKSFAQRALFDRSNARKLAATASAIQTAQPKSGTNKDSFSLFVDAKLFADFADIALYCHLSATLSGVPVNTPLELILTRGESIDDDALAQCVKLLPYAFTVRNQKDYAAIQNLPHAKEAFAKQGAHNNWRDYLLCKSIGLLPPAFDHTQASGKKRASGDRHTIVFFAGGRDSGFTLDQEAFQLLSDTAGRLAEQGHSVLITLGEIGADLQPLAERIGRGDGVELYPDISFTARLALYQQSNLVVFPACQEGLLGYCSAGFASLLLSRIDEDGSRLNDHQLREKLGVIGVHDRPINPLSAIFWDEMSAQGLSSEILKRLSRNS